MLATTEDAKEGLTELDTCLVWESIKCELLLLEFSSQIEDHLRGRIKVYVERVVAERQLGWWLSSDFAIEQKKRLEEEFKQARARMEGAIKGVDGWQAANLLESGQEFIIKK